MTANKHTPGPWNFYTEPQPNGCPVVGAKGLLVCMLGHSVHMADQKETALANARLIAAAPELLGLARELWLDVLNNSEEDEPFGQRVRAAIAKATGESP